MPDFMCDALHYLLAVYLQLHTYDKHLLEGHWLDCLLVCLSYRNKRSITSRYELLKQSAQKYCDPFNL